MDSLYVLSQWTSFFFIYLKPKFLFIYNLKGGPNWGKISNMVKNLSFYDLLNVFDLNRWFYYFGACYDNLFMILNVDSKMDIVNF